MARWMMEGGKGGEWSNWVGRSRIGEGNGGRRIEVKERWEMSCLEGDEGDSEGEGGEGG